jgi:hypothetical protein
MWSENAMPAGLFQAAVFLLNNEGEKGYVVKQLRASNAFHRNLKISKTDPNRT